MLNWFRKFAWTIFRLYNIFSHRTKQTLLVFFFHRSHSVRKNYLTKLPNKTLLRCEYVLRRYGFLSPIVIIFVFLTIDGLEILEDDRIGMVFLSTYATAPLIILLFYIAQIVVRLSINEKNIYNRENTQEFSGRVLYLRMFKYDGELPLRIIDQSFYMNLADYVYGAPSSGTIDAIIVKALGIEAPISKISSNKIDDFTVNTIHINVGDPVWRQLFERACDQSSFILIIPIVDDDSALLEEIKFISYRNFINKCIFVMPSDGYFIDEVGELRAVEGLWEKSRSIIRESTKLEMPAYSKHGGFFFGHDKELYLWTLICGKIWFAKKTLNRLFLSEKKRSWRSYAAKNLAFDLAFWGPSLFIMMVLMIGMGLVMPVMLIDEFVLDLDQYNIDLDEKTMDIILWLFGIFLHAIAVWLTISRYFEGKIAYGIFSLSIFWPMAFYFIFSQIATIATHLPGPIFLYQSTSAWLIVFVLLYSLGWLTYPLSRSATFKVLNKSETTLPRLDH